MSLVRGFCLACALLAPFARAAASDTPAPTLAVFVAPKGGVNLKPFVKKVLEAQLKAAATVVPGPAVQKAANKAKLKPKDVNTPGGALAVAKAVNATHVLLLNGGKEVTGGTKKNKAVLFFVSLTLLEVKDGTVLLSKRYDLVGKKLSFNLGVTIGSDVRQALTQSPTSPPAVAEEVAPAPATPAAPPDEQPSAAQAAGEPPSPPASSPPSQPTPPPAWSPSADGSPGGLEVVSARPESAQDATGVVANSNANFPARSTVLPTARQPIATAVSGLFMLQRRGEIRMPNAPSEPPCYCARDANRRNPFFPAAELALESFPLAILDRGAWFESAGIYFEGYAAATKTLIDPISNATVTSTVISANGGLAYRLALFDGPHAAELRVQLGYGYFAFPLAQGPFPSVTYHGPQAGGSCTLPFGNAPLSAFLGGHLTFPLVTQGEIGKLGERSGGIAMRGEGGLRLGLEPLEIRLGVRYERFIAAYQGATRLGGASEFKNVTLDDQILGGALSAGAAF